MRLDITDVVSRNADVLSSKKAVVDSGGVWSYRDLASHVEAYERLLRDRGAEPGRRIGLLMDGGRDEVAIILASLSTGAGTIPLNPRLTTAELATFTGNCRPDFVIATPPYLERVTGVAPVDVLVNGRMRRTGGQVSNPRAHPADEAIIISTGGTTGLPKAAVYSAAAVWHWAMCGAFAQQLHRDDVELFGSPFFHSTLLTGLLTPLAAGATVCIPERFDADHVIATVDEHGVTRIGGAPTMLSRVLEAAHADPATWRSVRIIQFGTTKSPPGFVDRVRAALPSAQLITGYGSTEFGPATRSFDADFRVDLDAGVGRPVPAARVSIIDPETGHATRNPAVEGEIAVSCPWQMSYYTGDATATSEVLRADGAILSGDIGRFDNDGYLHLMGRRKEIIITGGENVFPVEVEQVLSQLPHVKDLAVYGVADDTWGERVELAISITHGAMAPSLAEVRRFARQFLAPYKLPRSLAVLDDLPLTSNLKLDKRRLAGDAGLPRQIWPNAGSRVE
jgi:fatty-acyl-CoA synthase